MIDKLFEPLQRGVLWFSSKPNRLRVRGARIEVMAFVVTRLPTPSILLGQSPYHNMWMPPQEGVRLNESFDDALRRCLQVECGIVLPSSSTEAERALYVRSHRFMGALDLPPGRQGERPVADNAAGTALESVQLKRKAYWMSTVVVQARDALNPIADGKELIDLRWYTFEDARAAIRATNHPEKVQLLEKALTSCLQDLQGGASPQERRAEIARGA